MTVPLVEVVKLSIAVVKCHRDDNLLFLLFRLCHAGAKESARGDVRARRMVYHVPIYASVKIVRTMTTFDLNPTMRIRRWGEQLLILHN